MTKIQNKKNLISIKEAAELLNVSIDTLRRWDKDGKLHSVRLDGNERYFDITELKRFKPDQIVLIKEKTEVKKESTRSELIEQENQHAVMGTALLENRKRLWRLLTFQRVAITGGVFLTALFIVLIAVITFFFLNFPHQTAKFFGYSSQRSLQVKSLSYNPKAGNGQVLGAKYVKPQAKAKGSVLGVALKPFGNLSLQVVKRINPETYSKIVPQNPIEDVNDILAIDSKGNLAPVFTVKFPDATYLEVGSRDLITDLNADYLRGRVPGNEPGNLVILGTGGQVPVLRVDKLNFIDGSVIGGPLGHIADLSITTEDLADGTLVLKNFSKEVEFGDITEIIAGSGLTGGSASGSATLNIGDGDGLLVSDNKISITAGNGVVVSSDNISIDTVTSGATSTTSGNSGLEVGSDGLSLYRGCSANQFLKWNSTTGVWACSVDTGGGATTIAIEDNNSTIVGSASTTDFLAADFTVTADGASEADIAIDYTNSKITRSDQVQSITGSWTFSTTPIFSGLGAGIVHSNSSGVLSSSAINLAGGSSEVTGTLPIANGGTNASTTQGAINNISQLTTTGDILYHDGTNSTRFARGTNGQCLTSSATTLAWGTCGTGDITDVGDVTTGAAFTQTIGNDGNSLYFEGTTSDSNEIRLTAADVANDTTIVTIPAITGTLASLSGAQTFDGAKTFSAGSTFNGNFIANGDITIGDTSSDTLEINSIIQGGSPFVLEGALANASETTINITDPTTNDKIINLPNASGTVAVSASTPISLSAAGNISCSTCLTTSTTLFTVAGTSGTAQDITQGNTLTIAAGAGITTTAGATDTLTIASTLGTSVDLTSEITGVLPLANGGTNKNFSTGFTTGGIFYADVDSFEITSTAGLTGECLKSSGGGSPTWGTCGATSGDITQVGDVTSGAAFDGTQGNELYFEGTVADAGEVTLKAADPGISDFTITLPALTGTVALLEGTQTFTGAKTFSDLTISDTNIPFSGGSTTFDVQGASTTILELLNSTASQVADLNLSDGSLKTGASGGITRLTNAGVLQNITGLTSSGTITFSGLSTGIVKANSSGVLSSSALNLTADIGSSVLPIANGGTNKALTVNSSTQGSIVYSDADSFELTGQGTAGQCLKGGSAPVWAACGSTAEWNSLATPTGDLALSMGSGNETIFTWGTATTGDQFVLQDTTGNTGSGYLLTVGNVGTSTLKPFKVSSQGNTIIDTTATGGLTLGNATSAQPITIDAGVGTLNLGSGTGAKTINIGTGVSGNTVNIATDTTTADTIKIGGNSSDTIRLQPFSAANGVLYISATNGTVAETAASTGAQCFQTLSAGSVPVWDSCPSGSSTITLQQAYAAGNSIQALEAIGDIDFILADTTSDHNFDIDIQADNTVSISRVSNSLLEAPAQLLLLENLDSDVTIADGISICTGAGSCTVAGGGTIRDALDVSDDEIENAINVGDNIIKGATGTFFFLDLDTGLVFFDTATTGTVRAVEYSGSGATTFSSGASANLTLDPGGSTNAGALVFHSTETTLTGAGLTRLNTANAFKINPDGDSSTNALNHVRIGNGTPDNFDSRLSGSPDALNDLYVTGDLEVDGTLILDGFDCTNCLDFDDISDTPTLDANIAISQTDGANHYTWTQTYGGATGTGYTYNADSNVSGKAVLISADSLTTGQALDIDQTSTYTGSTSIAGNDLRIIRSVTQSGAGTTTLTGDVMSLASSLTESGGDVTDSSNILSLAQNCGTGAVCSGAVLDITNGGTGQGILLTSSSTGTLAELNASGTGTTTNGLLIQQTSSGSITNAINLSDETIDNALLVGTNDIEGTTATITFTDFTVGSDGNVSILPDSGSTALNVTLGGAPTQDIVTIVNTGQASTTNGVDALQLTYAVSNASGNVVDITPSYTTNVDSTFNVFDIDNFTATSNGTGTVTATVRGLNIGNLTESLGISDVVSSAALNIGTGWDNDILFATDATHTLKVQDQDSAGAAGSDLAITGAAGNTTGVGGAITITAGAAGATTGTSGGTLTLDSGADTGAGASALNIGTTNSTAVTIGNSGQTSTLALNGTGTLSVATATINLTGTLPTIDATGATTLQLNTTTNRPITTGTGLTTLGGNLTVNGTSLLATAATTITLGSTGADAITLGNGGADTITIGGAAATNVSITDDNWSVTTAGAATFTDLTATGNITFNDAGADNILIGAAADTVTITSDTLSLTDNNWNITAAGLANFVSIGAATPGTGAFTTLTSSGNSTIGTGASTINTFGAGAGSTNTIGNTTGTSTVQGSTVTLTASSGTLQQNIVNSIADALDIQEGTNNYLNINTSTEVMQFGNGTTNPTYTFLGTGAVTITGSADSTDALVLTQGDILVSNGDLDLSGGDFNVVLDAADGVNISKAAAPTTDVFTINGGTSATDGVDNLQLTFGVSAASGNVIDITPSYADATAGTTSETYNIIDIDGFTATQNALGDTGLINALAIGNLTQTETAGTITATGVSIGTGWDRDISLADSTAAIVLTSADGILTFTDGESTPNTLCSIDDVGTTGNFSCTGTLSAGAATFTDLTATGNITFNDAGADNILIGAAADTVTITSDTLSLTDNNWNITAAGLANFVSIGAATPGTGAFTTLTSSGNSTIGTGASTTNTFGAGAGSTNTIGNTTGTSTVQGSTVTLTASSGTLQQNIVNSIADALDIQEGTNNYLNINTSTEVMQFGNGTTNPTYTFLGTGAVTITGSADSTDALVLTQGDILVSNGDLDLSGGDFNVVLDAADGVNISKAAAPTTDVFTINGGTSATDGVDNLQLTFGVSAASGNVIDITPSYADATAGTTSETYNIIDIDGFTATQNALGDTGLINALAIGNLTQTETAGTITATGVSIGTGWDRDISLADSTAAIVLTSADGILTFTDGESTPNTLCSIDDVGTTGNFSCTGTLSAGAATFTDLTATGNITFNDAGADNILIGAAADTVTITSDTLSLTDNNWNISALGLANFVSIGAATPGTGAFTTLTSSGNSTIGTGASTTNTFGAGAGSTNTIGNTTGTSTVQGSTVTLTASSGTLQQNIVNSIADALDIQEGTNNYLNINTSTEVMQFGNGTTNPTYTFLGTGAVTITGSADSTDALVLTQGDILVSNGDLDLSGGDFNVVLDAADGVNISKAAAPTTDVFTINGGTSATDGVDNLQLTFGVSAASGNVIDITPSYADATAGTTSETYNIIDIDGFTATQNALGDTGLINALAIGNLTQTETAGTITATGVSIGTGWDRDISLADSTAAIVLTSADGILTFTDGESTPNTLCSIDDVGTTGNFSCTGTLSAGAATFTDLTATGNITFNDAGADNILIGAAADTVTITSDTLSLTDNNWNISALGLANFVSIGAATPGTGAFTTLTSSGNSTIGTGASTINTFGAGAGSTNTIGNTTGTSTVQGSTVTLTASSGTLQQNIVNSIADALDIQEGTNNYLNINTSTEVMQFGNGTTNPTYTFLGTGAVTITGSADSTDALVLTQGDILVSNGDLDLSGGDFNVVLDAADGVNISKAAAPTTDVFTINGGTSATDGVDNLQLTFGVSAASGNVIDITPSYADATAGTTSETYNIIDIDGFTATQNALGDTGLINALAIGNLTQTETAGTITATGVSIGTGWDRDISLADSTAAIVLTSADGILTFTDGESTPNTLCSIDDVGTTGNFSCTGTLSAGAATFTDLTATGNITFNDAGADNILIGAAADTVTITSDTLSLTDNNWNISALGLANFVSIGAATPGTGAFTTLTSSGNSTIGTGASTTNTFGAGAGSTNTIGNTTGTSTVQGSTVTLTASSGTLQQNIVNSIADALDIQEGTNNYLNINTSTEVMQFGNGTTNPTYTFLGTGAVTITGSADSTDALVLTQGDILVSNGDLDLSGGDFNVVLDAADGVNISKAAAPTTDVFTINGGTSATDGVDNLQLTFGVSAASGNVIDITPSYADATAGTTSETYNIIDIDGFTATQNALGDTGLINALAIGNLTQTETAGTITATGVSIGTGWDRDISLADSTAAIVLTSADGILTFTDGESTPNTLCSIDDVGTTGNFSCTGTLSAGAATFTDLTATGNITFNDAGADNILIGAAADTVTITSDTLSLTDNNWNISALGLANFVSIGAATPGTGAFTTLTSSGNSTIGTGASTINTFGAGAGSTNTIGNTTGTSTVQGSTVTLTASSGTLQQNIVNSIADALDIQEGTNNYLNINTSTEVMQFGNGTTNPTYTFLGTGAVTITGSADSTDALVLTQGDILVSNGDLDLSGGDFNVVLDAADGVNISKAAAPTTDVFTINGGTSATDGVDNLQLTFGVSAASGNVIDITPSYADATAGTTSETYNIIDIDGFTATQNALGDTGLINALAIGNLTQTETAGTITATGVSIGTGWDRDISLADSTAAIVLTSADGILTFTDGESTPNTLCSIDDVGTTGNFSCTGTLSAGAATFTDLTATGNITFNDAGADNILIGAAADTVTITSDTLSLTDNNWNISALGLANFVSIGAATPGTGAFTTLTSSGNSTIGTGASTTNTFGAGAGSTNTIGNTTGTSTVQGSTVTLTASSGTLQQNIVNSIADALDIQEGTNNYLNINTSTEVMQFGNGTTNPTYTFLGTGAVTITGSADSTDALVLTQGDILVSNGDLDLSGGDFNVVLDAADGVNISKAAAPTTDVFTINGGTSATDGVDNLQLTFGVSAASGNVIDITPSYADATAGTTSETYNIIDIDGFTATQNALGDTGLINALAIGNLTQTETAGTITATGVSIGTGWDIDIAFADSSVVFDGPGSSSLTLQDFTTLTASTLSTFTTAATLDFSGDIEVSGNNINGSDSVTRLALGAINTIIGILNVTSNLDVDGTTNDIAGTLNLSGNTLTSTLDLTINPTGGDVILADTVVFSVGNTTFSDKPYNVIANTTTGANETNLNSDDDLYIGGDLQVAGTLIYDTATLTCTDCIDWDDIDDTMQLDVATSIEATAGEKITYDKTYTGGGGEDGITFNFTALDTGATTTSQFGIVIDNRPSTEALDAALVIRNSDLDSLDPVVTGIKFESLGGGFTTGIDTAGFTIENIGSTGTDFGTSGQLTITLDATSSTGAFNIDNAANASSILVAEDNNTAVFTIADGGLIAIDPATTGTVMDFDLATQWTTGTVINQSFDSATTQTGNTTGLTIDFDTNFTSLATASTNTRNITLTTTGLTASTASTTFNIAGIDINNAQAAATALSVGNATATIAWDGLKVQNPNIVQTTGTISADGLEITTGTTSGTATQNAINLILSTVATGGTGNGLNISSATGGAGTLTAINIANLTSAGGTATNETALSFGTGWDREIIFNDTTPTVVLADASTLSITDGTNNLLEFKDLSTNFGAALNAGAFINRNSMMEEEFNKHRNNLAADTSGANGAGVGDGGGWGVNIYGPATLAVCQFDQNNTVTQTNGILRINAQDSLTATDSDCVVSLDEGLELVTNNLITHTITNKSNLPVVLMKIKPAQTTESNVFVGLGNENGASSNNSAPVDFMGFTSDAGTTWQKRTISGGSGSFASCSGQTISTTQFALLMIVAETTSSVRFYVDPDVSNGINFFNCGTMGVSLPTANLAPQLIIQDTTDGTGAQSTILDVDFFRFYQDDTPEDGAESVNIEGLEQALTLEEQLTSGSSLTQVYKSDENFSRGSLLSVNKSSADAKVILSQKPYDDQIVGVMPSGQGKMLENGHLGGTRVATLGRTLVKVNSENGVVTAGDYLTSSSIAGVAMKATKAGQVLGRVITQPKDGMVVVDINVGYFNGYEIASTSGLSTDDRSNTTSQAILTYLISQIGTVKNTNNNISEVLTDRLAAGLEVITPHLVADLVELNSLETFNKTVKIDNQGNAFFAGTITANKIIANQIEGLEIIAQKYVLAAQTQSSPQSTNPTPTPDPSASPSANLDLGQSIKNLDQRLLSLEQNSINPDQLASISAMLTEADRLLRGDLSINSLTVANHTTLNSLGITGTLTAGPISIDGLASSIDSLATLKIQSSNAAPIQFMGNKISFDIDGNINLKEGRLIANNNVRGVDVPIAVGQTEVVVQFANPRPTPAYAVTVSSSWLTKVAVTEMREDGFVVKFQKPAPVDGKIDWLALD